MQTIQVVVDERLLRAADRAARQRRVNRSALVREALRQYLQQLEAQQRERRDRDGYAAHPDTADPSGWEAAAVWPED